LGKTWGCERNTSQGCIYVFHGKALILIRSTKEAWIVFFTTFN
jgi:hypothetical protein